MWREIGSNFESVPYQGDKETGREENISIECWTHIRKFMIIKWKNFGTLYFLQSRMMPLETDSSRFNSIVAQEKECAQSRIEKNNCGESAQFHVSCYEEVNPIHS